MEITRRSTTWRERKTHQLHFVAYNCMVSSTSTSTKVRMTTDSFMRTESGLSLNDFTQTAPANVPSLRGILIDPDSTPTTPSTTFRSSSDLYPPATSTPTSGLSVFQPTPSPAPLLQTLPGDIFETAQSPLETVHQETMQPAQRSRPSRHSSKIPPPLSSTSHSSSHTGRHLHR